MAYDFAVIKPLGAHVAYYFLVIRQLGAHVAYYFLVRNSSRLRWLTILSLETALGLGGLLFCR